MNVRRNTTFTQIQQLCYTLTYMNMRTIFIAILAAMAALSAPAAAGAANLYVSSSGTATNTCTSAVDSCTLSRAAAIAIVGDDINVLDSVPTSAEISIPVGVNIKGAVSAAGVKPSITTGGRLVFNGGSNRVQDVRFVFGSSYGLQMSSSNLTFDNIEIDGGYNTLWLYNKAVADITFNNLVARSDSSSSMFNIQTYGPGSSVQRMSFNHATLVEVRGTYTAPMFTFYNYTGYDIFGGTGCYASIPAGPDALDLTFRNSYANDNGAGLIQTYSICNSSRGSHVNLDHTAWSGLYQQSGSAPFIVTSTNTLPPSSLATTQFIDPDHLNYRLRPDAPLINAGVHVLDTDADGNSRLVDAPDVGAYESPTPLPTADPITITDIAQGTAKLNSTVHTGGLAATAQWRWGVFLNDMNEDVVQSLPANSNSPLSLTVSPTLPYAPYQAQLRLRVQSNYGPTNHSARAHGQGQEVIMSEREAEFEWHLPAFVDDNLSSEGDPPAAAAVRMSARELAQASIDYWIEGDEESELRFSYDRAVSQYLGSHSVLNADAIRRAAADLVRSYGEHYHG